MNASHNTTILLNTKCFANHSTTVKLRALKGPWEHLGRLLGRPWEFLGWPWGLLGGLKGATGVPWRAQIAINLIIPYVF